MSAGETVEEKTGRRTEFGSSACIHERFEEQAARTPDAVAVSSREGTLTYHELNRRANRLAHYLRTLGAGPEVPIALYLERSPGMIVAILGVLKAGACYVPMDLAYPKDRLSFMLEDTGTPILITQESLRGSIPANSAKIVCPDGIGEQRQRCGPENPVREGTAENTAYIIYTSGSTGKPKGVLVTHQNVVRLLGSTEGWYGFRTDDVWPLFHSYAFDVSVWELWGSLFYGGRLVVVPYLVTRSPGEFYELLATEGVTVLNQTPSAFRQLIWAEANAPKKHELKLRYVICAGEALELQGLKPWFERHGDECPRVVNMYGITETTVHSTYRVIRKEDLTNGMGSVIGVPIPDLQLHLVDENLKLVPCGVPGEICVGGAGVARGYLNRPDLTNKRFLPDPFTAQPGARLYRSGDLAQINANGELEYLGRMDHQVKIRGFRVELGEIESALNRHPAIRESVVVANTTTTADKRLVAYAVPVATAPTVSELRGYLAQTIPDYMLPAAFVFLSALPLTTNGKVDRRALPNPNRTRPELTVDFVAPRTAAEQALAQIWSEVLEVGKVGVDDNFFELGGDSIRSITILSRARQSGLRLALQDVFQSPTVAGLAALANRPEPAMDPVRTQAFSLIGPEDRATIAAEIEDAYPVTRLQLGMFYHNELEPQSAIYHDVFSYCVQSRFDPSKLRTALQGLVRRHPQLRVSFHLSGFSQPLQLVHRDVPVDFTVEDLRTAHAKDQEARMVAWIESEKRRSFDRTVPSLIRFHAQIQSETSFQLFISFHHSCLDGWSLAAVVTEIFQDYLALLRDAPVCTLPPQAAYRDFVALEREALSSAEARDFWSSAMQGVSAPILPRWPSNLCSGGLEQRRGPEVQVPEPVFAGLRKLAQVAGVPLKTVLLAAHQRVLGTLHGQTDVLTGLITNGRPETVDGEKIIGLFLNTLPLRQQLEGGSWLDLVKQTYAAEQAILPHRRFPLAEIQKMTGGRPLFETAFDFVHFHVYKNLQEWRDLDLTEGHYFEANNLTTYTTFMLDVTSTRLELHIDYNPNVLCLEQVQRMTQYYLQTLTDMASTPAAQHGRFSPLSEVETQTLLDVWNRTARDFPRDRRLTELFEDQVKKQPETVALEFGAQRITFAQLNEQAEGIASHLLAIGLTDQELVGICLERSPVMVAALLGTLKAGGAYVPLDPAYPPHRLSLMIADANLRWVLTEKSLLPLLPTESVRAVCVEGLVVDEDATGRMDSNGFVKRSSDANALAYVLYTSGSTGRPKGVQVTHRSVVNLLTSLAETVSFQPEDQLLAVTTISFDIAALEIFLPLIRGGRVILADRETTQDGNRLAHLLEAGNASVMQATPSTWRLLLAAGWRGRKAFKVLCGGEALSRDLADELLSRAQEVWNLYGPTETTIWSTAEKVTEDGPVTIGRPLANTQAYILDPFGHLAPVGTAGELHLGGEGVARGYLGRSDLTAERFLPNPFTGDARASLYKTGDLARHLPDGRIECLGRLDHQVKIRGFRIELGEIETILRERHGIADALVAANDSHFGERRLVGYVVSKNGPPSFSELRDYLKSRLPAYMVPSQFVLLPKFPLTPNGKVDRKSLPKPENQRATATEYRAPGTADEQRLAEIWREVLAIQEIGVDDDFFDLGGDSLAATRAFARINRIFGVDLSLRAMLERPTIRALAELVAHSKGTAASASQNVIPRQPRFQGS
jgi:amino acid adenylation domain-containing protein